MYIRVASKSDAKRIYDIQTSSIREICAKHLSDDVTKAWIALLYVERYFKSIEKEEVFVVVVKGENGDQEVTGFGQLSHQSPEDESETSATSEQDNWDEAHIRALFIHPDHVGKGQGRYLLEYMKTIAIEKRAKKIVVLSSVSAVTFYLKHGFECVKRLTECVNCATLNLNCTKMEKQL